MKYYRTEGSAKGAARLKMMPGGVHSRRNELFIHQVMSQGSACHQWAGRWEITTKATGSKGEFMIVRGLPGQYEPSASKAWHTPNPEAQQTLDQIVADNNQKRNDDLTGGVA